MPAQNPDAFPIEREEGPSKDRYVVRLEGAEAEMTYSRAGESTIIISAWTTTILPLRSVTNARSFCLYMFNQTGSGYSNLISAVIAS